MMSSSTDEIVQAKNQMMTVIESDSENSEVETSSNDVH